MADVGVVVAEDDAGLTRAHIGADRGEELPVVGGAAVPHHYAFTMSRQLGSATGIALLATVGTTRTIAGRSMPNLTAYHTAFLVAVLLAVLPALTVEDADAVSDAPSSSVKSYE
ncbi:hypothetical protein [Streptomyces sp. NPDC048473]|uniref:hypothetical protein n=1 Tax=unclassified Streptomyces TaxID=2593676 RepID=UPI003710D6BD